MKRSELLTVEDVAYYQDVDVETVRQWLAAGRILRAAGTAEEPLIAASDLYPGLKVHRL